MREEILQLDCFSCLSVAILIKSQLIASLQQIRVGSLNLSLIVVALLGLLAGILSILQMIGLRSLI